MRASPPEAQANARDRTERLPACVSFRAPPSSLRHTPRIAHAGRAVGIDYGSERTGLAVADPLRLFAQPAGAVPPGAVVEQLRQIAGAGGPAVLVVGWPLLPSGEEGEATERVAAFIERLRAAFPEARVVRRDERYTSQMARDAIREFGQRRRGSGLSEKERVDAAAAALILQDWLDAGQQ